MKSLRIYSHFQIPSQPTVPHDFMPASVMSTDQPVMRDWFLYRDKIKHYLCEKMENEVPGLQENIFLNLHTTYLDLDPHKFGSS